MSAGVSQIWRPSFIKELSQINPCFHSSNMKWFYTKSIIRNILLRRIFEITFKIFQLSILNSRSVYYLITNFVFHSGLISACISDLVARSEGPIRKDFILFPSIKTVTIKMELWNHFQFFSLFITIKIDFLDQCKVLQSI